MEPYWCMYAEQNKNKNEDKYKKNYLVEAE
jgi:hypothetical protein